MGVAQTNPLSTLNAQAVIQVYSKKLRRKSISRDIYTNIRGDDIIYKRGKEVPVPEMFYAKVESSATSGANHTIIPMKMPPNANILRGRAVALGTEIPPVVKTGQIWRNNYRIVFQAEPGYGEDKLDAQPYNLYQEHVNDLYPHAAAEEGLEIRMGAVETFGYNLQAGSTAANCVARWNRNFFVLGLPINQQPVYHPNYTTYTNRIVGAIDTVSGGNRQFAQRNNQMLSCGSLDNALRWAFQRRMKPMMIDGWSCFVLTISQLAAQQFSNPTFVESMASRWTMINRVPNERIQNWYGALGVYQGPNAKVVIAIDDRLPTLLPGGTGEPYSLTAGYTWPTDDDLRNLDNPLVRDAMILHGRAGMVKWEPEPMHLIQQDWDYNLRNGKGYAGVRGIQLLEFDTFPNDTTGAAREHWGSAILVAGRREP